MGAKYYEYCTMFEVLLQILVVNFREHTLYFSRNEKAVKKRYHVKSSKSRPRALGTRSLAQECVSNKYLLHEEISHVSSQ